MVDAVPTATPPPTLSLRDVTSGYGGTPVVRTVSLTVAAGEVLALLGKNGVGKSTLLKTIMGLLPLQHGHVLVDGHDARGWSPSAFVRAGMSYAPQEKAIFQDLSIWDNLRLALPSDALLRSRLDEVARHFPILGDRLAQRAGTLSGGEQKMLILTRALITCPRLLLVDEITEGLQPSLIARIVALLQEERMQRRTTMLIVEQNIEFALKVANRWAVMKRGEIEDEGDTGPATREAIVAHLSL